MDLWPFGALGVVRRPGRPAGPEIANSQVAYNRIDVPGAFETSAVTGQGIEDLIARFTGLLADRVKKLTYRIPQARGDVSGLIYREGKVLETEYEGNDVILVAIVPNSLEGQLGEFLEEGADREEEKE